MRKRIVITGTGVVSSLGFSRQDLFDALLAGRSAVRYMPEWAGQLYTTDKVTAATVTLDTATVKSIERHYRRSMGKSALMATLASRQAMIDSGLTKDELSNGRYGCAIGSTIGSASEMYESAMGIVRNQFQDLSSCQFFKIVSHSSSFNVANYLGINGVQLSPCSACASALQAIGVACEQIELGKQDGMIAGGSDEATPIVLESFRFLHALANNDEYEPVAQSRPFDSSRMGLVCGEGAALIMIEEYEHAKRRGANILAEIFGYATNCTGAQISQSDNASIRRCMEAALADAGMSTADIDYVSAHATSTLAGDREEAIAIAGLFGDGTPVSSLKGNLGHTLGASGSIETAALVEALKRETILPTLNLQTPSEDCAGLDHVKTTRSKHIRTILKNCIAFGGVNATLIFGEPRS